MDSSNFSSAVPVRILLVDDYEPFRQYVRSLLMKRAEWVVLCGSLGRLRSRSESGRTAT